MVAIAAAVGVVMVRDLFRAALLLATGFVAVGGFYVLMNAEFLAVGADTDLRRRHRRAVHIRRHADARRAAG